MKVSDTMFKLFAFAFFAFALAFMDYLSKTMSVDEEGTRYWFIRGQLLMDLVCVVIYITCLNRDYKGIHLVCLLWLLIMPVIMFLNNAPITDTFQTILWPFIFETTYLCCRYDQKRWKYLKNEYIIFAIIGAYYFLITRVGADRQTNTIYFFALTVPYLLFNTGKRNVLIITLLFSFMALLSLKRSMMLSMVLIWAFFLLNGMRKTRTKIYTIVLSLVLLGGIYFAYDKVDEMTRGILTQRVTKEETDEGNGREAIWGLTINMIQTSTPGKLITGHGHYGVKKNSILDISAHNDFLEVIYDYGLLIFILYLCLWGHVIQQTYRLYKARSELFMPYAASLSLFFIMSMVSHLILYTSYFNYLVMFWGMIEAIIETERKVAAKNKLLS